MLSGEVLSAESNITFREIGMEAQALLCVSANGSCCHDDTTAQFLAPNGSPVRETHCSDDGMYVSKGKQTVRLNKHVGEAPPEEGSYCCSIGGSDGTTETSCVNIRN